VNERIRALVKDLLPPRLARALSGRRGVVRFSGDYRTWEEATAASEGYDAPAILEKVTDASLKVKRGEATGERDAVVFDRIEYSWMVVAGLMWAASRTGGRLNVLDFGGSLGTSYRRNARFLEGLQVSWSVVEQPHFAEAGTRLFTDGALRFHRSIAEAVSDAEPDVVLFESSLQYVEDPYGVLEQVARVPHRVLVVDRTLFSRLEVDRICVQVVRPPIYSASYPVHVFSRARFERWVTERGWQVIASHDAPGECWETPTGLHIASAGFLLAR
jgi:putative methyltransferase (TIGR04325 family)